MMSTRFLVLVSSVGFAALTAIPSWAWPERPIKLIAPSSPGGPPDTYARALAEFLTKELGQPVVVENVPAGGGVFAAQTLKRANADGHTLVVNTAGMMTIIPSANPRANYRAADFSLICKGVETGLVLASHPSIGAKDFKQFAQKVKAQKPPPPYSSYSAGSPAHFLGYQLAETLDVDMAHVPYKSSPSQVNDMLGGVAPIGFVQMATATPHIKVAKLSAYLVTSSRRAAQLPDVPTAAELGLPQFETSVWFGLMGHKHMPASVTQRLTDAQKKIAELPEFRSRLEASGLTISAPVCGDTFASLIVQESSQWARLVKATGFVAE